MNRLVEVRRCPLPQLYVLGHRAHHGMTGLLATIVGCLLMWHDRHDFPWTADG